MQARVNSCSNCGRSVDPTDGYFRLNKKTDRFELVCSECFELETEESTIR